MIYFEKPEFVMCDVIAQNSLGVGAIIMMLLSLLMYAYVYLNELILIYERIITQEFTCISTAGWATL